MQLPLNRNHSIHSNNVDRFKGVVSELPASFEHSTHKDIIYFFNLI